MSGFSAYIDTFARDNLPLAELLPECDFSLEALQFPHRLNCAKTILDHDHTGDKANRLALRFPGGHWTYRELDNISNQIAHVLVDELRVQPGERVLLRSPNNAMLTACWFGVLKAGGIVVASMPLLRKPDLEPVINKARIKLALCDAQLQDELGAALPDTTLERIVLFSGVDQRDGNAEELNRLLQSKPPDFDAVNTASDDVALIAFTSGTTGEPKGTMHFHRDVIAMCICVGEKLIRFSPQDIIIGSPPLAFTFGLGMLVAFPLYCGASTLLLESPSPLNLARAIEQYQPSIFASSPTAYRVILNLIDQYDLSSLKKCVSAGEHLPQALYDDWLRATGIPMINGLGTTELFHIFISATNSDIRPGAIGKPVPGFQVQVLDEKGHPLPAGQRGRLAVRGPTGCKYLADTRQSEYVVNGWNLTGDICMVDDDGYVWYHGRIDDLIISSGYNISSVEVEQAMLLHPAINQCAVIGIPNTERGMLVKAFVVLNEGFAPGTDLMKRLQEHVKATIAPYKYPRAIAFVSELPTTLTGKIQHSKLRKLELNRDDEHCH